MHAAFQEMIYSHSCTRRFRQWTSSR